MPDWVHAQVGQDLGKCNISFEICLAVHTTAACPALAAVRCVH